MKFRVETRPLKILDKSIT